MPFYFLFVSFIKMKKESYHSNSTLHPKPCFSLAVVRFAYFVHRRYTLNFTKINHKAPKPLQYYWSVKGSQKCFIWEFWSFANKSKQRVQTNLQKWFSCLI